jgi:predicted RNA-binding protein with PIN domain
MSLVYLVDAYNVIKRSPFFKNKKLKDARDAFFVYLEHHRPSGSLKNRMALVFDGKDEISYPVPRYAFEIIFTRGESADEKIKEMVASDANPKDIVVVTDDKSLAASVRALGAKIMATQEFLKKSVIEKKGPESRRAGIQETKAELNIVQQEEITEELRKIWIKAKSF